MALQKTASDRYEPGADYADAYHRIDNVNWFTHIRQRTIRLTVNTYKSRAVYIAGAQPLDRQTFNFDGAAYVVIASGIASMANPARFYFYAALKTLDDWSDASDVLE